jgi:fructoselysine-6-P-deglycase FrlB-like protein
MNDNEPAALMRHEIFEQPAVLSNLVDSATTTLNAVAERARHCAFALLAARGSSDNASTYGKYL